ncbi:uncharacterized protein METZ01_LOCUS465649, partial [marine metagenome]
EGSRNIQQTFSLLQVAEGSLNKIADIVRRMQGLAMQAASSVFNNQDRLNINSEFAHLRKEIDRTAGSTTYNGRKLLTGGNTSLNLVSTAAAEAATTGTSEILVDDASAGTYTFVDNPGVDRISLGNGVQTQTLNISEHLEEGVVPDGEHVVVRFDRLGISVTLTGTGVRGAAGQYSNGDLDGHTLVVDESDSLTLQVGPSETSNDMSRIGISDMRAVGANLNLADISIVTLNDARNAVDRLSTALTAVT